MTSPAPNRSKILFVVLALVLLAPGIVYLRLGSVPTVKVVTAVATSSPTGAVGGSSGVTASGSVVASANGAFEVEAAVNPVSVARIRSTQPARITLDAYPDTAFRGVVREVVPPADRQQATVQVKVSILDHDPRIQPRVSARVDFIEPDTGNIRGQFVQPRIRVPADAVKQENGRSIVWLVRDGRLEARVVDAGPESGGFREIHTGLAGGEMLLIDGVAAPREGMRVKLESR